MYEGLFDSGLQADQFQSWLVGMRGTALTYVNLVPNFTLTFGISSCRSSRRPGCPGPPPAEKHGGIGAAYHAAHRPAGGGGADRTVRSADEYDLWRFRGRRGGPILKILGLSTAFICLIAPINSILQAVGRADIPVKVVLAGGVIKLILNLLLIRNPGINILGSAYSTLACYLVMVGISLVALRRAVGVRMRWRTVLSSLYFPPCAAGGGLVRQRIAVAGDSG